MTRRHDDAGCGMTRLIRWAHLAHSARLSVLWCDGDAIHRTIVDDITLERLDGEPLPARLFATLHADVYGAGRYSRGVIEPAREALCS